MEEELLEALRRQADPARAVRVGLEHLRPEDAKVAGSQHEAVHQGVAELFQQIERQGGPNRGTARDKSPRPDRGRGPRSSPPKGFPSRT